MIVLDTDVISEIFRPSPEPCVVAWLTSLVGDVAITSVTLAELLAGVRRLPDGRRRDELTRRIDAALAPYRGGRAVLPFDDVAADRYAQIAAICLARLSGDEHVCMHDASCATRNDDESIDRRQPPGQA